MEKLKLIPVRLFARPVKCINCGSRNIIGGTLHGYRCLDCGARMGPY